MGWSPLNPPVQDWRGRSVWLVGASSGIGRACAQALIAAQRTVDDDRFVHSLHAYFLRPGNPAIPIVFEVERSRDGGTTWNDVTKNVGMKPLATVRQITPSWHDAGTAYFTADYHMVDDRTPHIYKTTDYGKTWTTVWKCETKDFKAADALRAELTALRADVIAAVGSSSSSSGRSSRCCAPAMAWRSPQSGTTRARRAPRASTSRG